jgi:hypothetical protein
MPYYFFNRCPENAIPGIEDLANELGLNEMECFPPNRQWEGKPFKRKSEYDAQLLLVYHQGSKVPFVMQTSPNTSHKQEDVRKVVKKLIDICKPQTIAANMFSDDPNLYDLREFN